MSSTRLDNILSNARRILQDTPKTRWSDADLLIYLSEGQVDLAKQSFMLKTSVNIPLVRGQHTYYLPSNTLRIVSVYYNGATLAVFSIKMLESANTNYFANDHLRRSYNVFRNTINTDAWRIKEGPNPVAIIVDEQTSLSFRVYPIPDSDEVESNIVGEFGAITSIEMGDYQGTTIDGNNGAVTDINLAKKLEVVTSYLPNTEIIDLEMPLTFDKALYHYIAYRAFDSDNIEQNIALSNRQLSLYDNEVRQAMNLSSGNFTSEQNHNSTYSPIM